MEVVVRRMSLALLVVVGACTAKTNAIPVDGASDTPDAGVREVFVTGSDGGASEAGSSASDCADDNEDIFVITAENLLYSFHPPTLEFTSKGVVNCLTNQVPSSMAVDRQGTAWVRYTDGSIWKVNTRDGTCASTNFAPADENANFYQFGMGFATTTAGGSAEELFLSDDRGSGLAKLDTTTLTVTPIGAFTGTLADQTSELTGTGDGKLYGFFTTDPAQIAEISETTGAILSTQTLANVTAGTAYAFSQYAGDFYIYTVPPNTTGLPRGGSDGSSVTRYRPSDGSVQVVKSNIGFTIVGAGVSTCAPAVGPK